MAAAGAGATYHFVANAVPGTDLYGNAEEACRLWHVLAAHLRGAVAVYVMGTHLHAQHELDVGTALGRALWTYARWRNVRRGERGRVFAPRPPGHPR